MPRDLGSEGFAALVPGGENIPALFATSAIQRHDGMAFGR